VPIPLAATSIARMPATSVGKPVAFATGLPSWPELFEPQQNTDWFCVTPHACPKPAELPDAVRAPAVRRTVSR